MRAGTEAHSSEGTSWKGRLDRWFIFSRFPQSPGGSWGSGRACLMDRAVLAARALELLHFLGSRASSASSWAWDLEQVILTCAAPQIPLHNGARSCLLHRARCRPHDAYASCAVPRAWLSVALQTSGRDFQKLMGKWKLKDSLFWYEKLKSV